MSRVGVPPQRAIILASIRDYLEQLGEEGLEGLPALKDPDQLARIASTPSAKSTAPLQAAKVQIEPLVATKLEDAGSRPPSLVDPVLARYPGLEKTTTLEELRAFIGDCKRCKLCAGRTNLVFGVGDPHAQLMFVGEGPGADEDLQGEPFVGRAGQLLTDIIERGMGIKRSEVYICNVVKCRPPNNRNPEADEVAACEPFLMRQIDLVKPRVIVGLGTFAVQTILRVKTPISKLRGNWHELRGIKLMPTFHPAYLLRNPADKRLVWADIQEVMKELGVAPPKRNR